MRTRGPYSRATSSRWVCSAESQRRDVGRGSSDGVAARTFAEPAKFSLTGSASGATFRV